MSGTNPKSPFAPRKGVLSQSERRHCITPAMLTRLRFLVQSAAAGLAGWCSCIPALAQEPRGGRERAGVELITAEAKTAIQRGLPFLSRRQISQGQLRGAFGNNGYGA